MRANCLVAPILGSGHVDVATSSALRQRVDLDPGVDQIGDLDPKGVGQQEDGVELGIAEARTPRHRVLGVVAVVLDVLDLVAVDAVRSARSSCVKPRASRSACTFRPRSSAARKYSGDGTLLDTP